MKSTASSTRSEQERVPVFTEESIEIDKIVKNESRMGSALKYDVYIIAEDENGEQVEFMTTIRFGDLIDHIKESGYYDDDPYDIGFKFERHMIEAEKREFVRSYLVELQAEGRLPEITFTSSN